MKTKYQYRLEALARAKAVADKSKKKRRNPSLHYLRMFKAVGISLD